VRKRAKRERKIPIDGERKNILRERERKIKRMKHPTNIHTNKKVEREREERE
jgi:hypothetical protein